MKKILLIITLFLTYHFATAQKAKAFEIYNKKGKKVSYKKLLKQAQKSDIIFIGEEHDNPVAHWFEIKITKDLYQLFKKKGNQKKLELGAEMMEADDQEIYNKYLNGEIDFKQLKKEARLWPNFKTDYKALLDFAKKNKIPFTATNIPRRYANKVFKNGFSSLDSLSQPEKEWIAPLPIAYDSTLTSYVAMTKMKHMKYLPKEKKLNMPKAQAIKDATMAHFILKNHKKGNLFIHYNGSYHSNDYQGIVWYIKKEAPEIKILTIDIETQDKIGKLEEKNKNKADYIIVVDPDFPRSY
jgi:uncharacterized iron-regulated protein